MSRNKLLPFALHSLNAAIAFANDQSKLLGQSPGVRRETEECYLLTYQPAPISAWVLHPQGKDSDRPNIETIIQRAITRTAS